MFALSIALLGVSLIAAMFTVLGETNVAEGGAVVVVAGALAAATMIIYWRRLLARQRATQKVPDY